MKFIASISRVFFSFLFFPLVFFFFVKQTLFPIHREFYDTRGMSHVRDVVERRRITRSLRGERRAAWRHRSDSRDDRSLTAREASTIEVKIIFPTLGFLRAPVRVRRERTAPLDVVRNLSFPLPRRRRLVRRRFYARRVLRARSLPRSIDLLTAVRRASRFDFLRDYSSSRGAERR